MKLTLRDVDGMTREAGAFPYQRTRFGHQPGHLAADELVARGLLAVRMQLVRVADVPGADGSAVVVRLGFAGSGELGALGIERISVLVLGAPDGFVGWHGVDHEHGVLRAVDVGVDAEAE